jgi:hypothetical protein
MYTQGKENDMGIGKLLLQENMEDNQRVKTLVRNQAFR